MKSVGEVMALEETSEAFKKPVSLWRIIQLAKLTQRSLFKNGQDS